MEAGFAQSPIDETQALIVRMERNLHDFLAAQGERPGASCHQEAGYTRVISGLPGINRIIRCNLSPDGADQAIATESAFFHAIGESYEWLLTPSTRPSDLGKRLASAGLCLLWDLPAMFLNLRAWTPDRTELVALGRTDETVIRHLAATEEMDDWRSVAASAYPFGATRQDAARSMLSHLHGLPAFTFWLLSTAGKPVSVASSFRSGEDAGLFWFATLPEFRGKGYAGRIGVQMLKHLRGEGVRRVFLQASDAGHGLYANLGFRDLCRVSTFRSPARS